MRAYFARHVGTYGEEAPMPCEDCQHSSIRGCSCKASRYWESSGKVLMKHRTGWDAQQGTEREPAEQVPDSNIKFVKHSWNSK